MVWRMAYQASFERCADRRIGLVESPLGRRQALLSILLEGSRISNYVYVWISGNGEIVLNTNAAGVVGLRAQPFARGEGATPAVQITA
jgi:hypothetical protein